MLKRGGTVATPVENGFAQYCERLPCDGVESSPGRSLWATDSGFFYTISMVPALANATKKFVTPVMMPFCEVLKGDLDEGLEDFRLSKKREVSFAYLGRSARC